MTPDFDTIQSWLIEQLAERLGVAPGAIDVHEPFASYGLPSSEAVVLSGDLEEWLGRRLAATVVWQYPTVAALARYLAGETADTSTLRHRSAEASSGQAGDVPTSSAEPVAIIGIGCRFPGADGPEAFWRLLRDGVDAIREVPADRWNPDRFYDADTTAPGKMNTRWGGFLDQVDQFDPSFFCIAPREAARMDPQQRLLLEVAWEALEHAGLAPDRLYGSQTGVFVGISSSDYAQLQLDDPGAVDAYTGTGSAHSIAANRLSYLLDLHGPSMAVDTACSSSLVALHLACQSLRAGECDMALAGGVNLILTPQLTIIFSKAHMMAADGHCKTFDAAANGYVRGEGCGVVVLKPLAAALADGDRIVAVVRGSALNQDGLSNGLTAPNGLAQQAVIRRALERAGIAARQLSYVETHGTGTPLGDPIEVEALKGALLPGRAPDQICALGSVKTNIGHLEAGAGIAGLIKAALALYHGEIPPHLHLRQLNPHIALDGTVFTIPAQRMPWPAPAGQRYAGVSSFGFGGTNAHVVLGEAPAVTPVTGMDERPWHILALSAQSEPALRSLARRYVEFLESHPDASLADICFTANSGRLHFIHRLAAIAGSVDQLREQLAAFARGDEAPGLISGQVARKEPPKLAFLFTGQGAQYPGMGRQLYQTQPTFRQALNRCAAILDAYLERPLLEVIFAEAHTESQTVQSLAHGAPIGADEQRSVSNSPGSQHGSRLSALDETAYTQPALFALGYALSELWRAWGVEPAAVMGHSVGEYGAACAAGVFSLEDGLRLIATRGRLMQALPRDGAMLAVFASEERVTRVIAPYAAQVSVAAVNGPSEVVISGARAAVQAVAAELGALGVKTRALTVSHAFHSPLMEPMLAAFEQAAAEVAFAPPRIPLVANVTGQLATAEELADPRAWRRHARAAVRFADGIATLHAQGCELFVEIGPHATLAAMGSRCLPDDAGVWLPSLRKGHDDWPQLLASLGALYVRGAPVDWAAFDRDYARRRLALPTYPFERRRCWFEPGGRAGQPAASRGRQPFDDWMYELVWQPANPPAPRSGSTPGDRGRWLVFADRGAGAALARLLAERGDECVLVFPGAAYERLAARQYRINPAERGDVARLFADALDGAPCRGLVHLWSLEQAPEAAQEALAADPDTLRQARLLGCGSALLAAQELARDGRCQGARLWLVTRGAQPAANTAPAVAQTPLWGLGRVIALEHPELWGGLIDLDPGADGDAAALLAALEASDGEDQVALRGGRRYTARLVPRPWQAASAAGPRADASYLITGGLGGLGLLVARWLVERGARHLVLMGRRGLPDRTTWDTLPPGGETSRQVAAVRSLEALGATVRVAQADAGNLQQMSALFADIAASHPPLRGVIHAAGVASPVPLAELTLPALEATLWPKVMGAWVLHQLTQGMNLDFFVCFSSVSAVLGSKDLAHYAAANHFLDGLAHARRAAGLPGMSISWGPWAGAGMITSQDQQLLARMGMAALPPEQALAALEQLLGAGIAHTLVADIAWEKFLPIYEAKARRPLLAELAARQQEHERPAPGAKPALIQELEAAPASERPRLLADAMQREVAKVMGLEPTRRLDPRRGFFELGMDSLMAIELKRRLDKSLGITLPRTVAFEFPTIEALAGYLVRDVLRLETPPAAPPATRAGAGELDPLLAAITQLSDDSAEALLLEELATLKY